MMTKKEIKKHFREVAEAMDRRQLKVVFDQLTTLLSGLQNWQLEERLSEQENLYKMMLSYLVAGVKDPRQDQIYHDLLRSVFHLIDQVALHVKTENGWSLFYERRKLLPSHLSASSVRLLRELESLSGKLALKELLEGEEAQLDVVNAMEAEREEIEQKVFQTIWLSDAWRSDEREIWSGLLKNKLLPQALSSLIISAIILNLEELFDEQKVLLLLEACENENEEIRQRALIALLLFLRRYDSRLYLYPKIGDRLQLLAEEGRFTESIRNIILQFIISKETEKVTRKIKEEILPEMLKISPKLGNKLRIDDLMGDSGFDDKNPEWQNILEESGLTDKLQEFSEMQMAGVDVMHSSFIHLKNFPFFSELSHWFLPFMHRSETSDPKLSGLVKLLSLSSMLCNSDKYSFFFSISGMPESVRKMMTSQFSAESSAMQEMMKDELPGNSGKIDPVTRQYIQDLYRFYKLHPRRREFEDIFESGPEFYQIPSVYWLIDDPESLMIIGESYFNRNYFSEAEEIFVKLLETDPHNEMLFQKAGYCRQMQGDLDGAIANYLNAELLNENNSWTIRKLAYCYRAKREYGEALAYYRKAEKRSPQNLSVQLNIGHTYLELKEYEEALKAYFKVEYLSDNKEKVWRPIAWTSFLNGKYEQSLNYYRKVMDEGEPNATDYLNAGHVYLATGDVKEAIRLYGMSLKEADNSPAKFREAFENDIPDLLHAGVSGEDIPFILDKLMYES